jgi:hypothetical protein
VIQYNVAVVGLKELSIPQMVDLLTEEVERAVPCAK